MINHYQCCLCSSSTEITFPVKFEVDGDRIETVYMHMQCFETLKRVRPIPMLAKLRRVLGADGEAERVVG